MFEELAEYEAAIRADERLKCAREVEAIGRNEWRNDVVPASVLAARLRAGAGTPPKACPTCEGRGELKQPAGYPINCDECDDTGRTP